MFKIFGMYGNEAKNPTLWDGYKIPAEPPDPGIPPDIGAFAEKSTFSDGKLDFANETPLRSRRNLDQAQTLLLITMIGTILFVNFSLGLITQSNPILANGSNPLISQGDTLFQLNNDENETNQSNNYALILSHRRNHAVDFPHVKKNFNSEIKKKEINFRILTPLFDKNYNPSKVTVRWDTGLKDWDSTEETLDTGRKPDQNQNNKSRLHRCSRKIYSKLQRKAEGKAFKIFHCNLILAKSLLAMETAKNIKSFKFCSPEFSIHDVNNRTPVSKMLEIPSLMGFKCNLQSKNISESVEVFKDGQINQKYKSFSKWSTARSRYIDRDEVLSYLFEKAEKAYKTKKMISLMKNSIEILFADSNQQGKSSLSSLDWKRSTLISTPILSGGAKSAIQKVRLNHSSYKYCYFLVTRNTQLC